MRVFPGELFDLVVEATIPQQQRYRHFAGSLPQENGHWCRREIGAAGLLASPA
jgi:hypothetical protein